MAAKKSRTVTLTASEAAHEGRRLRECMRKLSGHVASGSLQSFTVTWSAARGINMNVNAALGRDVREVFGMDLRTGLVDLKEPPPLPVEDKPVEADTSESPTGRLDVPPAPALHACPKEGA